MTDALQGSHPSRPRESARPKSDGKVGEEEGCGVDAEVMASPSDRGEIIMRETTEKATPRLLGAPKAKKG